MTQTEAVKKLDTFQFKNLDNQLLVEAFSYSLIPEICIACQELHKPEGQHFQCLADQDGYTVAAKYEASEPEAPLADICASFRSCPPTSVVYDPSGHRRPGIKTMRDRVNFHTLPPGAS